MALMLPPLIGTPASRPAARMPSLRRVVIASSRS
jgi:hypothetical protein